MKHYLLLSGAALLALATPAFSQEVPQAYPESSGLDAPVDDAAPAEAAPAASTGDPVLDRLNALETRIHQLEARNAELEAANSEVQTRVQKVEVRAATAVQSGPAPTFADVTGDFTFKPRGTLQLDYANYIGNGGSYAYSNGTDIRRARFGFEGTAFRKWKWRLDAEYVKGTVTLLDAYVQYPLTPKLTVTVGQHKAPYGLEANSTDAFNSFLERGMANVAFGAVGAERRVGVSLGYASDHLYATAGLFGSAETVQRSSATPDEAWSFNGRLVWEPIVDTDKLVHVGVSGYRAANFDGNAISNIGDRPGSRVDGGRLVSASIAGTRVINTTTGVVTSQTGAKSATYVGAEAAFVYGPFSLQGEYNQIDIDRFGAASTVKFDGFYAFGSWFLTGESRAFKGGSADRVKPFNDFNPEAGKWGAVELLVRYDQLDLTDNGLQANRPRKGTTWTAGVNWYLNPNTKLIFNYIKFKGEDSPLKASGLTNTVVTAKGDILATRLQFDF